MELQGKDPDLRIVAEWLRANQPPATSELRAVSRAVRHYAQEWSRLEVVDGVLFRRYTADTGSNWLQLLVPASLRTSVLAALHDHPVIVHPYSVGQYGLVLRYTFCALPCQAVNLCCVENSLPLKRISHQQNRVLSLTLSPLSPARSRKASHNATRGREAIGQTWAGL